MNSLWLGGKKPHFNSAFYNRAPASITSNDPQETGLHHLRISNPAFDEILVITAMRFTTGTWLVLHQVRTPLKPFETRHNSRKMALYFLFLQYRGVKQCYRVAYPSS
jgi:hypothetical protein